MSALRELYVEKEVVAEVLHKSVSWVLLKSRIGQLPSRKIGQKRLFVLKEIEDWAAQQLQGPRYPPKRAGG